MARFWVYVCGLCGGFTAGLYPFALAILGTDLLNAVAVTVSALLIVTGSFMGMFLQDTREGGFSSGTETAI